MRARPERTKQNTLNFLNEIYNLTNEKITYVSLQKLCIEHKISSLNGTTIVKSKLLLQHRDGYTWNSTKPNLKMADRLLIFNRQINNQRKTDKVKQIVSKPIEIKDKKELVTTKQQRYINVFWGMFIFNY